MGGSQSDLGVLGRCTLSFPVFMRNGFNFHCGFSPIGFSATLVWKKKSILKKKKKLHFMELLHVDAVFIRFELQVMFWEVFVLL